jgi:diketogulonate reductase-like aldo/keto reductase
LAKSHVTSVIVGVSKSEQLADNISAVRLTLTEEELKLLDDLTALPSLYPYNGRTGSGDQKLRQALGHSIIE